jgi:hypothetical protein
MELLNCGGLLCWLMRFLGTIGMTKRRPAGSGRESWGRIAVLGLGLGAWFFEIRLREEFGDSWSSVLT